MALRHLRISSLRCIEHAELALHPERNYLFGPNGAGKTSVLEAAYLLGRGRSFRTRQVRKLVRAGIRGFSVYGEVEAAERRRRLGVAFDAGRLEKKLDGEVAGMAELAAALPIHAIEPGLHYLVEGAPGERRRFLDWGVFHVKPQYLGAWRRYRRVLSQRNAALKAGAAPAELRSWSDAVASAGQAVDELRSAYVAQLSPAAAAAGAALLGSPVGVEYRRGWPADRELDDVLRGAEASDRQHGTTELGPHRADLRLSLDAHAVRDEASRGQQKLVATALVLGQVEVHYAASRTRPVVLVDDPAAELDQRSVERLLGALDALPAQLIIAGLSAADVRPHPGAPVFHVERGKLRTL